MRMLYIAFICFVATESFATFGNYPLVSNTMGKVADWQCLYSGIVERCRAADQSEPALSFSANITTGLYVSSVTTGAIYTVITTNDPPTTNVTYYYTTNWANGDVTCILSNWTGTNVYPWQNYTSGSNVISAAYEWHGPMTIEELAAWDVNLLSAATNYLDVERMASENWLTTPIGSITNKRIIYADPCADTLIPITNSYVKNVYRTQPLTYTISNLFTTRGIGTDFYYAFDEASTNTFYTNGVYNRNHDWRFTMVPTQSVILPLAMYKVVVTNTFYTTNVFGSGTNAVTNVVENYELALGRPTNTLGLWWYTDERLPTIYPKVPVECIDYRYRTNAAVYLSVICPNTNTPAPDLSDAKLNIIGAMTYWTLSNAVGYSVGLVTCQVSGITHGKALDAPMHEVMEYDAVNYWNTVYDCVGECDFEDPDWYDCWLACDMALVDLSTSSWARVETNGQWDTMIGTTVTILWSNTVAFYGYDQVATWNGVGSTYNLWPVNAQAMNERYLVITSLVTTCKFSPAAEIGPELAWLATYREYVGSSMRCLSAKAACKPLSSYNYVAGTPTKVITRTFAKGPGYGINDFSGGARFGGAVSAINRQYYTASYLEPVYLINYAGVNKWYSENLYGTPYIRMANLPTNNPPPAIESIDVYAMPQADDLYPAYLDESTSDAHLQYDLVGTISGPIVGNIRAISSDYFYATNWVFVDEEDSIQIPNYGLLSSDWWDWKRSSAAGVCAADDLCSYKDWDPEPTHLPPPQCVVNAASGDPIWGDSMADGFSASDEIWFNLMSFITWDFQYK